MSGNTVSRHLVVLSCGGTDFKVIPDQFHLLTLHINVEAGQNGCYSADDIRSVRGFLSTQLTSEG